MTAKSDQAFRTISEVSAELGVPQHVLRMWETKFGLLRPMKRAGGRRYYRPLDMQVIETIKFLLEDRGLTMKMAQKVLREHGVDAARTINIVPEAESPQPVSDTPTKTDITIADVRDDSKLDMHIQELRSSLAILKELRATLP